MKVSTIKISLIVVFFASPILATNGWMPKSNCIEKIEKDIILPKGASLITEYSRYYTGQSTKNEKQIIGIFILSGKNKSGIHIVPQIELPRVLDGGCKVIHFKYSVKDKKIVSIFCSGLS